MKLRFAIIPLAAVAVALITSVPAFAAKGNRKKDQNKDASPTFAELDKDNNGSISKTEYVAGMKTKLGSEEAATKRFGELDKDKDDTLSKEELAAGEVKKKKRKKNTSN